MQFLPRRVRRDPRTPRNGPNRRSPLLLEQLEGRSVPTILVRPTFGPEAQAQDGGAALSSPPVYLIFWGSSWGGTGGTPPSPYSRSIGAFASEVINSPYLQVVKQYGSPKSDGRAFLRNGQVAFDASDPPNKFQTDAITQVIRNQILPGGTLQDTLPELGGSGLPPIYVVITQPDVVSALDGASGYNATYTQAGFDILNTIPVHYIWCKTADPGDALSNLQTAINQFTLEFSHEMAEAMSDPGRQGFEVLPGIGGVLGSFTGAGPNESQIGDYEPESGNGYVFHNAGLASEPLVQAVWSRAHGAFEVDEGNAQDFLLTPVPGAWTLSTDPNATPSFNQFYPGYDLQLLGDQESHTLGTVDDHIVIDSLFVDDPVVPGLVVTLNNESVYFDPGTIRNITIDPGLGVNEIDIKGVPSGTSVLVQSTAGDDGPGHDTVVIGSDGTTTKVVGDVNITGDLPGNVDLTIDDSARPTAASFMIAQGSVSETDLFTGSSQGTISYGQHVLSSLSVRGGGGALPFGKGGNAFTVDIERDPAEPLASSFITNLDTGTGPASGMVVDSVTVVGAFGPVNIRGDGRDNGVRVLIGPGVDGLFPSVNISNDGGATALVVDDSGDTTPRIGTLTTNSYFEGSPTNPGGVLISWTPATSGVGGVDNVGILGGDGDSTYQIDNAPGGSVLESFAGGAGNDTFVFGRNAGVTGTIDGGGGVNTLDYTGYGGPVSVDLAAGTATGTGGIFNIQNVMESSAGGTIKAGPGAGTLTAGPNGGTTFVLTPATGFGTLIIGSGHGDTLVGANVPNTWAVTGDAAGTVDGVTFSGISNLVGGGDNDAFNVGTGNVAGIGGVSVDGGGGVATLVVDDRQNSSSQNAYVITGTSVTLDGVGFSLGYSRLQSLTLDAGSGGNIIALSGTAAGTTTTVNAGPGGDTVYAADIADYLPTLDINILTLDKFLGPAVVNGRGGNTTLVVDGGSFHTLGVTGSSIAVDGSTVLTYGGMRYLYFTDGFNNTYDWQGTAAGTMTELDLVGPGDTINLGDANHTLDSFLSAPVIESAADNTLNIYDQGSTAPHAYTIASGVPGVVAGYFDFPPTILQRFAPPGSFAVTGSSFRRDGLTVDYFGASEVNVYGGSGGNTIDWQGNAGDVSNPGLPPPSDFGFPPSPPYVTTTVHTGTGVNTITVGNTAHTLDAFGGTAMLVGQGSNNTVTVDDSGSATAHAYVVTGTAVSRDSAGLDLGYSDVQALALKAGGGANTITVGGTAAGTTTTVYGGPTVAVLATSGPLNLDGNGGSDTVTVGTTDPALGGLLAAIQGPITIGNTGGQSAVRVDDSLDASPRTGVFNNFYVDLAPARISFVYPQISSLTVDGGSGGNDFQILSSVSGAPLTLNPGTGANTIEVGNLSHLLSDVTLPVTINGQSGRDALTINGGATGPGPETFALTATTVTAADFGGTSAPIAYANVGSLYLAGGTGANTFNVQNTPAAPTTLLGGGSGPDTFNIRATGGPVTVGDYRGTMAVTLGSLAPALGGTLARFHGTVTVANPFDPTGTLRAALVVDGSGDSTGRTWSVGGTAVSVSGIGTVAAFGGLRSLALDGGSGSDTFALASPQPAYPVTIHGNGTSDTLAAANQSNAWKLTGANRGTLNGRVAFVGVPNLTGGASTDTFAFAGGGSVSGAIDGGGGTNTLDYSAYSGDIRVDLLLHTASLVGQGVFNVANVLGSRGDDLIVGDANPNVLIGGTGRNVLVGGGGGDALVAAGAGSDSLLIAGTTDFDSNPAALNAIFAEWTRTDLGFRQRFSDLSAGSAGARNRVNGQLILLTPGTVHADSSPDTLIGSARIDPATGQRVHNWFFADADDTLLNFLAKSDHKTHV